MFLCYLAVQRYNFFVENKIFPNFFTITFIGTALAIHKTAVKTYKVITNYSHYRLQPLQGCYVAISKLLHLLQGVAEFRIQNSKFKIAFGRELLIRIRQIKFSL